MRQAVVFIGGSRDSSLLLQRTIAENLRLLNRSNVVVPKAARRSSKVNGLSHQRLAGDNADDWSALADELSESDATTALLVIPNLLKLSKHPARAQQAVERLSSIADQVTVVSVIADQLTMINDYYLNHVATWRTSARLTKIAPKLLDNEAFVHERALRPWYSAKDLQYRALTAPEYADGNALEVVLRAAGITLPDALAYPDEPVVLGPVGVEANRLLATSLRADIAGFGPDTHAVASASRAGLARAQRHGWCEGEFWGWTARVAGKAIARFAPSNERFAAAVWGTGWPLPYPDLRPNTQVDLLDLEPETIERILQYVAAMTTRVAERGDRAGEEV